MDQPICRLRNAAKLISPLNMLLDHRVIRYVELLQSHNALLDRCQRIHKPSDDHTGNHKKNSQRRYRQNIMICFSLSVVAKISAELSDTIKKPARFRLYNR